MLSAASPFLPPAYLPLRPPAHLTACPPTSCLSVHLPALPSCLPSHPPLPVHRR